MDTSYEKKKKDRNGFRFYQFGKFWCATGMF